MLLFHFATPRFRRLRSTRALPWVHRTRLASSERATEIRCDFDQLDVDPTSLPSLQGGALHLEKTPFSYDVFGKRQSCIMPIEMLEPSGSCASSVGGGVHACEHAFVCRTPQSRLRQCRRDIPVLHALVSCACAVLAAQERVLVGLEGGTEYISSSSRFSGGTAAGNTAAAGISVGDRVVRGPSWNWGQVQDGGPGGYGSVIDVRETGVAQQWHMFGVEQWVDAVVEFIMLGRVSRASLLTFLSTTGLKRSVVLCKGGKRCSSLF